MIYVSVFLYFLALIFAYKGFRSGSKEERGLAFAFFAAGLGTTLITIFALTAIQTV